MAASVVGTAGNDRLIGRGNGEFIDGRAGLDTLVLVPGGAHGAPGRWFIDVQSGIANSPPLTGAFSRYGYGLTFANIENVEGSGFIDYLYGSAGNNILSGLGGNDTIDGRGGNDTILGGAGADLLTGGTGADIFRWLSISDSRRENGGLDTVTDFQRGDLLDVSGIDANTRLAGDQAFAFIGTQAFHRIAGELRFSGSSIQADVNGDGAIDFEVNLTGIRALQTSDFIL